MNLVVNFTPTGMIPTKTMTDHVPVSVNEIVEDVHRAVEIGITMVHIHARDDLTGKPTYKTDIYAKIIAGIRRFAADLVLCVSLSGRTFQSFEKRIAPLKLKGDLKPDMGSLTLSSVNFNNVASVNAPEMIKKLALEMMQRGVAAELEAFDVGMINYASYLAKKQLLAAPYYFNLILGNIACAQADLLHLGLMVRELPDQSIWSAAGIGHSQLAMNAVAIAAGGGVRVGLEDNIWFDDNRTTLATNQMLLKRIHRLVEANGRTIMPPREFRQRMGLAPGQGRYGREL